MGGEVGEGQAPPEKTKPEQTLQQRVALSKKLLNEVEGEGVEDDSLALYQSYIDEATKDISPLTSDASGALVDAEEQKQPEIKEEIEVGTGGPPPPSPGQGVGLNDLISYSEQLKRELDHSRDKGGDASGAKLEMEGQIGPDKGGGSGGYGYDMAAYGPEAAGLAADVRAQELERRLAEQNERVRNLEALVETLAQAGAQRGQDQLGQQNLPQGEVVALRQAIEKLTVALQKPIEPHQPPEPSINRNSGDKGDGLLNQPDESGGDIQARIKKEEDELRQAIEQLKGGNGGNYESAMRRERMENMKHQLEAYMKKLRTYENGHYDVKDFAFQVEEYFDVMKAYGLDEFGYGGLEKEMELVVPLAKMSTLASRKRLVDDVSGFGKVNLNESDGLPIMSAENLGKIVSLPGFVECMRVYILMSEKGEIKADSVKTIDEMRKQVREDVGASLAEDIKYIEDAENAAFNFLMFTNKLENDSHVFGRDEKGYFSRLGFRSYYKLTGVYNVVFANQMLPANGLLFQWLNPTDRDEGTPRLIKEWKWAFGQWGRENIERSLDEIGLSRNDALKQIAQIRYVDGDSPDLWKIDKKGTRNKMGKDEYILTVPNCVPVRLFNDALSDLKINTFIGPLTEDQAEGREEKPGEKISLRDLFVSGEIEYVDWSKLSDTFLSTYCGNVANTAAISDALNIDRQKRVRWDSGTLLTPLLELTSPENYNMIDGTQEGFVRTFIRWAFYLQEGTVVAGEKHPTFNKVDKYTLPIYFRKLEERFKEKREGEGVDLYRLSKYMRAEDLFFKKDLPNFSLWDRFRREIGRA